MSTLGTHECIHALPFSRAPGYHLVYPIWVEEKVGGSKDLLCDYGGSVFGGVLRGQPCCVIITKMAIPLYGNSQSKLNGNLTSYAL